MKNARSRATLAAGVVAGAVLLLAGIGGQATRAAAPNPPVTAGLQLWYEADTSTDADGQAVTTWADKSGFGRDLSSFGTSDAPTMRRNAVNGRSALEFNGTSSLLKTYGSTFTIAQPSTFFIVYRSLDADTSSRAFVFDSRDSSNRQVLGRAAANTMELYANVDLRFGNTAFPFPDFQIWSGTLNGTASSLSQNGIQLESGNAGASSLNGFTLGGLNSTAQYGYDLSHALISEVLYYNGPLGTGDSAEVTDWLNEKYNVIPPPSAPANTSPPSVSGTVQDGSTVTAVTGSWAGTQPIDFDYQWKLCDSGGSSCVDIDGATNATHTITSGDIGSTFRVSVTASNSVGSTTVASAASPVVAAGPPANTATPSVGGVPQEGATLTASNGVWRGTAPLTFSYQWQRCNAAGLNCAPIPDVIAQGYPLTAADIGFTIRVAVTASNTVGDATASSTWTATVVSASSPPPPPTQPPVATGLELWFEADTAPYDEGQAVMSWADKSGFGRDLSSFSTADAPIMRRNAVNGRAAIEFDGIRSLLKTYNSTFTLPQPTTFFIVYRSLDPDTSTRAFVFDSRDSTNRQVLGRPSSSAMEMYANQDRDIFGVLYPFPSFQAWSGTFNGASSSMYRNGSLLGVGNAGGASLAGFTLGGLSTSDQYGYDLSHSEIAEVLYYSESLSQADRLAVTLWLDQKYNVIGPPTPPGSLVAPTISGTPRDGLTLTTSDGFWSGTEPLTYVYQWQRCDSSGSNCSDITGATARSYKLTSPDVGSKITVVVTASNSVGSASTAAAATAVVAPTPPVKTTSPTLSGTPREGSTLTTANGTWSGTPLFSFTYQWQRCDTSGLNCQPIPAANEPSYLLQAADVAFTIRAAITATNIPGSATASSAQTSVIVAVSAPEPPSIQPPVTTGLGLWFEADTEQYAEGQTVATWEDKSGNARNLTAFDPSQAPAFHRGAVNGRAAIEFNGVSSLLKTYDSTFTLPQPTTFFIVYRSLDPDTSARAFVFDSRDSGSRQVFGRGAPARALIYGNLELGTQAAYPFPSFQIWSGTFNGATSSLYGSGALEASGNAGGGSLKGFTVGGLSTSTQYGYDRTHSQVAEILYYTGNLSLADRQDVTAWLDQKYAAIGALTSPAVQTAPAISGTVRDGSTLTSTTGSWSGSRPLTYTYQWRRCDNAGANCSDILLATSSSYTLTAADVDSTVTVAVTASNSVGFTTGSAAVTVIVAARPPSNATAPSVTGPPRENATLTTTDGTWNGTPPVAFTYQWQRCDAGGLNCDPILGGSGNAQSYQLVADDVGHTIRSTVTATNTVGNASTSSAQTLVIVAAPGPVPAAQPPLTAGLELWFEADTLPYTEGQAVQTWTDKSGNGRNLTAFAAGQAPVLHQAAVNGRAAIEFNGTSSLLKTYGSAFTIAQPDTFFVVYKSLDTALAGHLGYVFDSTNSAVRQLFGLGPLGNTELYANIDLVTLWTYPFASYEVWSGTFNGASSSEWNNGVQVAQGNAGSSSLSGFTVGALSTTGQYGYSYGHSLIAEILFYSGSVSNSDRAAITAWLNQKYAAY